MPAYFFEKFSFVSVPAISFETDSSSVYQSAVKNSAFKNRQISSFFLLYLLNLLRQRLNHPALNKKPSQKLTTNHKINKYE